MTDIYSDRERDPLRQPSSPSGEVRPDSPFQASVRRLTQFAEGLKGYRPGDYVVYSRTRKSMGETGEGWTEASATFVVRLGNPDDLESEVGVAAITSAGIELGVRQVSDEGVAEHSWVDGGVVRPDDTSGLEPDVALMHARAWVGRQLSGLEEHMDHPKFFRVLPASANAPF